MNQTEIHGLSQWEKPDRILMEDFNADNQKIEQALAGMAGAQSEMQTALALCGNCKIVYGSYKGKGNYGSGNKNTLSFDLPPIFVMVIPNNYINNKDAVRLNLLKNVPYSIGCPENSGYLNTVSWSGNQVQWYGSDTYGQFNSSSYTYHYFALLDTNA